MRTSEVLFQDESQKIKVRTEDWTVVMYVESSMWGIATAYLDRRGAIELGHALIALGSGI